MLMAALLLLSATARAADYEIQVYPGPTAPAGSMFVELHSNLTPNGPRDEPQDERQPSAHAVHETLELTRGFTGWFETGLYLFTSARSGEGWDWVGTHIRPRVAAPASWGWPVGASLSVEVGYLRPRFSESRWDLELRPIVDWQHGAFYVSFNPTLERNLRPYGGGSRSFQLSPQVKVGWLVHRRLQAGLEYYGNLGPVERFAPGAERTHLLFPVVDLAGSSDWEINAGPGFGLTRASDRLQCKLIVGRRF